MREQVMTEVIYCDVCLQKVTVVRGIEIGGYSYDVCGACVLTATKAMVASMLQAAEAKNPWSVEDYGQGIWYSTKGGKCRACNQEYGRGDPMKKDEYYGWVHKDCAA